MLKIDKARIAMMLLTGGLLGYPLQPGHGGRWDRRARGGLGHWRRSDLFIRERRAGHPDHQPRRELPDRYSSDRDDWRDL